MEKKLSDLALIGLRIDQFNDECESFLGRAQKKNISFEEFLEWREAFEYECDQENR